MSNLKVINQLRSALNQLKDDDLVPALFLMEMDDELNSFRDFHKDIDRKLMSNFIQTINTIKELSEIRKIILDSYSSQHQDYINDYINEISKFNILLKNRGRDLSKYQSDQRLLAFALNHYNERFRREDNTINDINNHFYRLLFIIFCHPYYSQSTRDINIIEENFSQLINKHLIHFVKNDTLDFYRWAKNYMDNHEKYQSTKYSPITDEEYKTTVNIIFDKLFNENEDIYSALKDKLANAWYQKKYRQKHKGKKPYYYALSKRAKEALHILAFKKNMTEEQVIEHLINKNYIEECADYFGESLY